MSGGPGQERKKGAFVDPANPLGHLFGKSFDEVLDQNRNVLSAFSQRRHVNGDYIHPIEKILSKLSGSNHSSEVTIG